MQDFREIETRHQGVILAWGTRGRRFKSCQPDVRKSWSEVVSSDRDFLCFRRGGSSGGSSRSISTEKIGPNEYDANVELMSLIETRPGVRSGKPTFVGTRITVYDVLEYLASGMTSEAIVADFPELTGDHVRAALEFAANREHRLASPA
jgi:uncharacterized protein (DUF433 family)